MKHSFTLWYYTLIVLSSFACTNIIEPTEETENKSQISEPEIISTEEALSRLNAFIIESSDIDTQRIIQSIDTRYSDYKKTRSGDLLPEVYVINYADNKGFSILGANKSVSPIVAITDSGNIDPDSLFVKDILGKNTVDKEFFASYLKQAILSGDDTTTRATSYYDTPAFMQNYLFTQIRTYCHDDNNNASVSISGCGPVAVSLAVAYNNFPIYRVYTKSGMTTLDYSNVNNNDGFADRYRFVDPAGHNMDIYINRDDYFNKSNFRYNASFPDSLIIDTPVWPIYIMYSLGNGMHIYTGKYFYPRTQYLLQACIFYQMDVNPGLDATSATNSDIENCLHDLGYINVSKRTALSITNNMLNDISNMLHNNKPVIAGGWSLGSGGHFWIIDGAIYSGSQYLIHCNWGWGGVCNGYFKPAGKIKTNTPYDGMYDHPSWSTDTSTFTTFATFTYDIPANQNTKSCFLDSHYGLAFGN